MIVAESDVLIDALAGREPGARAERARRKVEKLLAALTILPFDERAGRAAPHPQPRPHRVGRAHRGGGRSDESRERAESLVRPKAAGHLEPAMEEIGLDRVRQAVRPVLRDVPEVAAAYAYGSRVGGRALPLSDPLSDLEPAAREGIRARG